MSLLTYILIISLISASISYTICCAGIFEGLRRAVTKWGHWWEDLIHCPYCFGHYVTFFVLILNDIGLVHIAQVPAYWTIIDHILVWFACMCVVSLLHFVMVRAYKPVAESETLRKMKEKFANK